MSVVQNKKQPPSTASKPDQTQASHGCFEQFKQLLLLLLKLKAWRLAAICVPIALAASALFVLPIVAKTLQRDGLGTSRNGSDHLLFYGASDLAASKAKVLVDRSSFPAEAAAATSIVKNEGGNSNWMEECASETDCRERLMFDENDDAIVALIRYSKTPDKSRSVLECPKLKGPKVEIRCAFLYKVMVLSMQKTLGAETFKEMQIYELFDKRSNKSGKVERYDNKNTKSLPNSACADWIKTGLYEQIASLSVPVSVSLSAIGVNFYLLVSTVSCIRMIKTDGFLQQLFRSGLSVSAYWLVIWLVTALECLFFAGVFTASNALGCLGVFPASAMARLFILFTLFCLNLAAFMLLLELLLPPLMLVSIVTIVMSIGLLIANLSNALLHESAKFLLHVFSPLFATEYIIKLFNSEVRRQFSVAELKHEDDSERLSQILTWTAIGLLLFALLLTYLDFMLSSGNGLCLSPHYPFMPDFWCPKGHKDRSDSAPSEGPEEKLESHIEPVMELPPIIAVKAITKTYRNCCLCCQDATAVLKNLSCTIYRGQITALIGHNGAGKSTLIKILTGEELPDEGTAHIGGCLVTNPLLRLSLRGRISTCPQFDVLCDSLTVMECIRVTLVSRAASDTSQLERARGMLQRLGLGDKEDVLSCDLSGGQKRKVSTILALLGDPDVVFLDEPTSGLDPVSRRQLWQLLQEEKSVRSIILCTQFMDEADILADRKIFLCGGKIVCAGSSMFLKRAFGCSFTLNVSLKSKSGAESLLAKLKQVHVKSHEETELRLQVPALDSSILTEAVHVLETSTEVETFGLSQASLGDIFMRLSGMESDEVIEAFKMGTLSAPNHLEYLGASVQDTGNKEPTKHHQRNLHYASVTKQFLVLFSMNIKRQLRVTSSLMSRFLVPTALLALICAGSLVFKDTSISSLNDAETIQMGMLTTASAIRSRDFGDASLATACIVDGSSDSLSHIKICESLALHDPEEGKIPIIVYKPAAQSLREFLSNDTTRKEILRHLKYNGWINKDGSLPPCVLYYASSWLESIPNAQRSVTVGVLISDDTQGAAVHIYRRALAKVFRVFGISDVENTTALSFIRPVGASVRTGISMQAFFYAICLFPVSYLNDPIEDISSRVRSHLMSTGMGLFAYWMNTFAMHWIQYALCFMSAVALLMISEAYRSVYLTLMAFLPAYIFGIVSNLLTVYAIAAVTRTRSTIVSVFCNMFVVIMPLAITHISNSIALQLLVWLVPPAAPLGLIYSCLAYLFYKREYYNSPSGSALPGLMESINKNPAIFYALLAMPVHIVVLSGIICLAENSSIIRVTFTGVCCSGALDNATYESNSEMDEGARNEAERVLVAPLNKRNVLEVRNLRKTYANGVHAVRGVTYGAMTDEIFGLLGANGAGKSTSMSVIVGEEAATEGVCKVRLHSNTWMLSREAAQIGAIGYCPQHNPLFNSITVAEHIRFYADIRGLNSIEAERQTNSLITSLGLAQHWNTEAGQLSAGSKRRLCLAIALLGDPALIVIDEASTGVDPENKRFIWGAIRRMVHKKRSVMVTTHSMEEVEALCSRVGIMNKGRMISVGTVQQLRSRHGDAYTLDLLLEPVTESAIKQRRHSIKTAVLEQFKGAQTQEDLGLGLVMQFSVPKSAVRSLSDALRWLAANQSRLGVSYWAFYQMSLDQVFVKLVKTCDEMAQKASKGAL